MNVQDEIPGVSNSLASKVQEFSDIKFVLAPTVAQAEIGTLISLIANLHGTLTVRTHSLQCWIGDLLAYGQQRKFKGQITEYANAAGLNRSALSSAKTVCIRIPPHARREGLSWSCHMEIGKAFKTGTEINEWLNAAVANKWSRAQLRDEIRKAKAKNATALASQPSKLLMNAKQRAQRHDAITSVRKYLSSLPPSQRREAAKLSLGSLISAT